MGGSARDRRFEMVYALAESVERNRVAAMGTPAAGRQLMKLARKRDEQGYDLLCEILREGARRRRAGKLSGARHASGGSPWGA